MVAPTTLVTFIAHWLLGRKGLSSWVVSKMETFKVKKAFFLLVAPSSFGHFPPSQVTIRLLPAVEIADHSRRSFNFFLKNQPAESMQQFAIAVATGNWIARENCPRWNNRKIIYMRPTRHLVSR